ncbi:MAG: ATP-binding protein, partial [Erysipelotrichaceae bacterium]|nr:ATP-binding protein [Erysipelotrichaceae bacterium]
RVKYIRLPDLFAEFETKKIQGKYREYLKELKKYDLLILDEFLLVSTSQSERNDLLELMEAGINRKSTIFASQWLPEGWHERLGGGAVADAILDRIINSSYTIPLYGDSLREEYSLIKK